jgi:hypothetical protein
MLVVVYQRFGTASRSQRQGSSSPKWLLDLWSSYSYRGGGSSSSSSSFAVIVVIVVAAGALVIVWNMCACSFCVSSFSVNDRIFPPSEFQYALSWSVTPDALDAKKCQNMMVGAGLMICGLYVPTQSYKWQLLNCGNKSNKASCHVKNERLGLSTAAVAPWPCL